MRLKTTSLIAVILLLIVIGCSDKKTQEDQIQYQTIGNDPIILLHDLVDAGMDMEVVGTLKYDNNKCLYLYNDVENKNITPIWPEGSTPLYENDLRGVKIPGYGTILEGDEISTSGGGIDRATIKSQDIPSECLENEMIVVITPEF